MVAIPRRLPSPVVRLGTLLTALRGALVGGLVGVLALTLGAPDRPVLAADAAFLAGVEDVPLMPGLAEVEGAATVFDAPQGRIVETFAAGSVSADEVRSFYGQTLPQLGWTAASALEFRRAGERLSLEITPAAATTVVRFTLAPQ